MNVFKDYDKKLVIPRWLSFRKALASKELSIPRGTAFEINTHTKQQLAIDYADFKSNPTPHKASDLMSAALVLGDQALAKETAIVVADQAEAYPTPPILAQQILVGIPQSDASESSSIQISKNKRFLSDHPRNPYIWLEQARLYTLLGQPDSARRCVFVALNLAPVDRHVLRSAARFFIHTNDLEPAWYYLQKASALIEDPWIRATEINVAELLEKKIRKIRDIVPQDLGPAELFHFSELIETAGILELTHGNDVQARRHFKRAWKNPSANVVAHAEWILRHRMTGLAEDVKIDFSRSLEATTLQNYHNFKIWDALLSATEWALEEPYSKQPFTLGSFFADHLKRFDIAERLAREGLRANPGDFTLNNNLCFALLKNDCLISAEKELSRLQEPEDASEKAVYFATSGLLQFKKGHVETGCELYQKAIKLAIEIKNHRLAARAAMYLAIAQIEAGVPLAWAMKKQALSMAEQLSSPDIVLTREELLGATPDRILATRK
jgi:tetratricopeptide (TPR) repeat protein